MSPRDNWPKMPDGQEFDGQHLLTLTRNGSSPFQDKWDVNLLIHEIEENLHAQVVDIPYVSKGSNNYGIHIKLSDGTDIIARLARGDVNMPDYDGFPIQTQIPEVQFEAAVYKLLQSEPGILASHLLYYRLPVQHQASNVDRPKDIAGRRLLVFKRAEGEDNVWSTLNPVQKSRLLVRAAKIRASLYNFQVPPDFASTWLRERLFEQKPESFPIPVAPTREFCVALFTSKIEATIKNIGDMIGWEDDHNTVGPVAAAAKQSLLRFIPHIMPVGDEDLLYRFVIDHGDVGVHNILVTIDANNEPRPTSLYDWETGCIVPAILSDPLMAVTVDLFVNRDAEPSVTRLPVEVTIEDLDEMATWSREYFQALYLTAPNYRHAIEASKDARYLWFALRDWRGDDPEDYFGSLGAWAERKMERLHYKPQDAISRGTPTYHFLSSLTNPYLKGPYHVGTILKDIKDFRPLTSSDDRDIVSNQYSYTIENVDAKAHGSQDGVVDFIAEELREIKGNVKGKMLDDYLPKIERLETVHFFPEKEYISNCLKLRAVKDYLSASNFRNSVYLITGLKIARGAPLYHMRGRDFEANAGLTVEAPAGAVDVDVEAKIDIARKSALSISCEALPIGSDTILKIKVMEIHYMDPLSYGKHDLKNLGASSLDNDDHRKRTLLSTELNNDDIWGKEGHDRFIMDQKRDWIPFTSKF
ncbi:hypothetical protein F4806DRAFT_476349 [Annulohypoxylon nitens]|nr:hypothetical protein F4806DRAFT_476349 [Annulohypoxylon nitens]